MSQSLGVLATTLIVFTIGASACGCGGGGGGGGGGVPPGGLTITIDSGNNQSGPPGSTLASTLVVLVSDGGVPQPGRTVTFQVTSLAGGSVFPTSQLTNAAGKAETIATLPNSSGTTLTVRATVDGVSVDFTATAGTTGVSIQSINPTGGSTSGGTQVTITGTGFVSGLTTVRFGSAQATGVTVQSSTSLTAMTPPSGAGAVNVVADVNGAIGTLFNGYTYSTGGGGGSTQPWVAMNAGATNGQVSALLIDPSNAQVIYRATFFGGIDKSTNGATSWTNSVNTGAIRDVRALATDPTNTQVVYATVVNSGNFVVKTTDGGGTWSSAASGIPNTIPYLAALLLFPSSPSTLLASPPPGAGVFRTTDGGASWAASNSGLLNGSGGSLARDAGGAVYLGGLSRCDRSTDGGTTWTAAAAGMAHTVNALAAHPTTAGTVYAATSNGGVYRTTNGGTSWSQVNTGLVNLDVRVVVVAPSSPSTLYAGTANGIFKSTDGGSTWADISGGLTTGLARDVQCLAVDATNANVAYAGTNGAGVFKTTSGGQ